MVSLAYGIARCAVIALMGLTAYERSAATTDDDVRAYARASAFALPALSPDGTRLSHVEQSDDRQTVLIRSLADGTTSRTLSVESRRERIRWCDWAGNETLLCGTIAPRRAPDRITETTRLHAIDVASAHVRELNGNARDSSRAQIIDFAADRPGWVLLQHDVGGRGYPQVSALNVRNGEMRTVVRARAPVRRWMSDNRRQLVLSGSDVDPPSLYLFDNDHRTLTLVGHHYPEPEARPSAPMRSVTSPARDGQAIPAFSRCRREAPRTSPPSCCRTVARRRAPSKDSIRSCNS